VNLGEWNPQHFPEMEPMAGIRTKSSALVIKKANSASYTSLICHYSSTALSLHFVDSFVDSREADIR